MEKLENFKGFAFNWSEIAEIFLKMLKYRYLCRETVATFAFQWLQPSDRVRLAKTSKF